MPTVATSPRLPARYFAQLVDYLESTGIDRNALLQAARIRRLTDPQAQLTLRQAEALFEAAERASGRLDLGLELGRRIKLTSHDLLGYALLTSPTLGHAVRLLASYQRLIQPVFALHVQRSEGRVELVYRPVVALSHRSMRIFQEAVAVSNHFEFGALMRREMPPYDLWMSIERPPHATRYRELAPARVHFEDASPGLRMSLDASLLETPLSMANPRSMRAAEERCKAILRGARSRRRWSDWCRMMLVESHDCQPTLDELAGFVNLSTRTLARYLDAEGTSFRELSLAVRVERACEMLADPECSVTQVAYCLGYSDVARFVRSFRARTGRTPTEYRATRPGSRGARTDNRFDGLRK